MQIRQKLTGGFLGISLLTAVIGISAIYQQSQTARELAIKEAEHVADIIATSITHVHGDNQRSMFAEGTKELQAYTNTLHDVQQRDIVVVDLQKQILADAIPENVGTKFEHDLGNEIVQTIKDGATRTFVEKSVDYPEGIKLIVSPLKIRQTTLGAVILEYTPLYNEAMATASQTMIIIAITSLSCGVLAIALGLLISRNISIPLQAVTQVAQKTTQEANFDLQAPVTTSDETGQLATALNQLIVRVKELLIEKEQKTEELQKANEKLTITQKQMVAQEKLASLGSLTAGIAHEIRNPLNFVNNFAQLCVELVQELSAEITEQITNLDEDTAESVTDTLILLSTNVSKIEHHGQRAEKIVGNMLLHARNGGHQWESSNLNELLEETVNLAYHGMRAKDSSFNVTFDTDYDKNIGEIEVVTQDISRAFLNILSNACYAVQQKLKQQRNEFTPILKIRTRNLGLQVEIRIRDNGSGMTPEVRDRIFEHFFTTKPTGEGTGLGLSLTYDIIVQQHQGSLEVESEVDVYTEFIISLPKKNQHI